MQKETKYIFVTGGVLSGLGKGIAAASIGAILKARGFSVNLQKCDPYLNFDAGTLNPGEHGEVFVTDDGAETDLDLGHYERFTDTFLTKKSSVMSGQIYNNVLSAEREGKFLGKTVQVIPHVIKEAQKMIVQAGDGFDVHITEIGGTVGDYEAVHFIEAIRQFKQVAGKGNIFYIHLVYLPFLETSGELKSKPAQNSVRDLKSAGIQPDMLILRADKPIPKNMIEKLALYTDVEPEAIIPLPTINTVYKIPTLFENHLVGDYISASLGLPKRKSSLEQWEKLIKNIETSKKELVIGMVAKYMANWDTYASVTEAVKAACWNSGYKANIKWIDAELLEKKGTSLLDGLDGILVPGGFGSRGIEGKILAAKRARENNIPYLGLCLGMQIMAIEFARNVLNFNGANSTEFDANTKYPVIHIMEDQKFINKKGGTMRLGAWPCILKEKSNIIKYYSTKEISERHRHRYEFNNEYRKKLEEGGLDICGTSPDNSLVEAIEIKEHPFMIGVQYHPEFKSRPLNPHPLFEGYIKSIIKEKQLSVKEIA
jgi:CTP synthase